MPSIKFKHPWPRNKNNVSLISSRSLIYLPIIHTSADLGALKDSVTQAALQKIGRFGMTRRTHLIDNAWSDIEKYIDTLDLYWPKVRLYQDGLPICNQEIAIVTDLAEGGSRNHKILLRLITRGAILMGTESKDLLIQEYNLAKQSLEVLAVRTAGARAARQSAADSLLVQRDKFIASRINETLKTDETGILFIGMFHAPTPYLDQDIAVLYPLRRPR
jgi:hypothetical protein